ncbi:DUF4129 domain-containing transglutaminase family protein [Paenibacillus koleovorans]|uniref:DUF4129 domain-containing transglutaminase family protein n=1 Tax=Paenibacillus koleovorans TaxID=121608 RepID=UPI000FD84B20|nr:transglutaminase domain-containing protein [Paenibacillus koleovorans]
MAPASERARSYYREAAAAALLFVLLIEWLRPLAAMAEHTDLHMLRPFVLIFAGFLLLDYLRVPLGWSIGLKVLGSLSLIGMLFYPHDWPGVSWLGSYMGVTGQDLASLVQLDTKNISPHNRTLLFLTGWAMLISVMYNTVVERMQTLWFVLLTILYLLALQLGWDVDTGAGILRAFIAGMLLMAIGQLARVEGQFAFRFRPGAWSVGWTAATAAVMALAIGAGLWMARDESRMPGPLEWGPLTEAWLKLFPSDGGRSGDSLTVDWKTSEAASFTGYGEDDSRLGAPLLPDNSVAFRARTERETYWRGESRSTYTGRGWVGAGSTAGASASFGSGSGGGSAVGAMPPSGTPNVAVETIRQEIALEDLSLGGQLFAGGRIASVEALMSSRGDSLPPSQVTIDALTGRAAITAQEPLAYYRLLVEVPALLAPPASSAPSTASSVFKPSLTEQERAALTAELQLPSSLPSRVGDLARAVTVKADGDYAKALAVQTFLRSGPFKYSLDNPSYPVGSEDFVDKFLFEDQAGYCNHFSTSMVVMLRTLGIPARWVKGFAPGQLSTEDASPDEKLLAYTVLNRDAHSWVEAYIAGQGWVSFEPTPGFAQTDDFGGGDLGLGASGGDAITTAGASGSASSSAAVAALAAFSSIQSSATPIGSTTSAARTWDWSTALENSVLAADATLAFLQRTGSLAQNTVLSAEQAISSGWERVEAGGRQLWVAAFSLLLLLPLLYGLIRLLQRRRWSAARAQRLAWNRTLPAYDRVWRKVQRKLGDRRPDQTVREYIEAAVKSLPEQEQRDALLRFASLYESARYAEAHPSSSLHRGQRQVEQSAIAELWERISRPPGSKSSSTMR